MSDLRKSALIIAVGALLSASSAMAQLAGVGSVQNIYPVAPNVPVQNLNCNVSAVPLTVRTEGYTELLGDVRLTCNGALQLNPRNFVQGGVNVVPQLPAVPQLVNISVTLSTPVTSRTVVNSMTEALLFIGGANGEEATNRLPGAAVTNQNPCPVANVNTNGVCSNLASIDGAVGSLAAPTPANSRPTAVGLATGNNTSTEASFPINVFQGQLQNANTVVFLSVPISQVDSSQNPNIANQLNLLLLSLSQAPAVNNALYAGQAIIVPFTKNFRIKNLRGAIPGAAAPNGQVFAFLSIQNPPANLQLNSASAVVGFVQQGLIFDRRTSSNGGFSAPAPPVSYAQCEDFNRNLANDANSGSYGNTIDAGMILRYTEGYANSFKIRGFLPGQAPGLDQADPTQIYNTESGFYNTLWTIYGNNLSRAGIADHGTRLRASFGTVPANIRLFVTVGSVGSQFLSTGIGAYGVVADATGGNQSPITVPVFATSTAYNSTTDVRNVTFNTFGAFLSPFGPSANAPFFTGPAGSPFQGTPEVNGYIQVPVLSGAGAFTWEVYSTDPRNPEAALFGVIPAWRFANNPALGTVTVQGSFAPVNATAVSSGFLVPIPRFQDTSAPLAMFRLDSCVTNLLYPFVTNIAPFDTGIAISNTSLSNPGTGELFSTVSVPATQQGACSINYFGFTGTGRGAAPAPATSGVIPAGQTLVFTLSAGGGAPFGNIPATPGFQGYIIAQCAFRYAHGYAFISDLGATQLAQGYLALVMDNALGSRTGQFSESLSN